MVGKHQIEPLGLTVPWVTELSSKIFIEIKDGAIQPMGNVSFQKTLATLGMIGAQAQTC